MVYINVVALQVHLYERARKLRPSGGSIGLTGFNAFAALRAISPKVEEAVWVRTPTLL